MAPKIKIPVRRTGRALAHLHSKPSPHTRLVPRFAGTLRSPQIEMRSAHGWRQPELHFGEACSSLPGIPRTAWRRFAGTLRSPQIKMRSAHGWRQPELHFGEARTRFPASHEPPGGASREPCAHLRSKCASRMGGGSEFEKSVSIAKNNTTTMSWCYFLERATRLELATSTLARWRSTR